MPIQLNCGKFEFPVIFCKAARSGPTHMRIVNEEKQKKTLQFIFKNDFHPCLLNFRHILCLMIVLFDFKFKCILSTECFVVNSKPNFNTTCLWFGREHLNNLFYSLRCISIPFQMFSALWFFFSFSSFFLKKKRVLHTFIIH